MDYRELRDVMKFLHCKGWTPRAIYADMCETLGDSAPSYGMVKKWVTEFRKGRISTEDLVRPGRPKDVSTYENLDFIQSLVRDDDRVTVQDIVKLVTISFGSVHTIISKLLELTKVSGRWVQRRIGHNRRMERIDFSKEILAKRKLDTGPMVFLTVVDDPWIHHFKRTKLLIESEKEFDDFKMPTTSGILNRALSKSKMHDASNSVENVKNSKSEISTADVSNSKIFTTNVSNSDISTAEVSNCEKALTGEKLLNSDISMADVPNYELSKAKMSNSGICTAKVSNSVISTTKVSNSEKPNDEKGSNSGTVSESPIQDLNVDSTVEPTTENGQIDRSTPENGPPKCQNADSIPGETQKIQVPNILALLNQPNESAKLSTFGLQGISLAHLVDNQAQLNAGMLPNLNIKLGMLNPFYGVNMDQFTEASQNKNLTGQKRPRSDAANLAPSKRMRSNSKSGMSCIFWDSEGVILVENLQPGQQLNGKFHGDMLARLRDAMVSKRSESLERGVLLVEEHELEGATPPAGLQVLRVPHSSPDLSPSDFHIFPKVKEHLRWLPTAEDSLMPAVEKLLTALDPTFFKLALVEMERRCTLCVDQNGDHVEK